MGSGRFSAMGGPALYLRDGDSLSHDQLAELLNRAERELSIFGVGRQTRVMTSLPDCPLTACVLLAVTRTAICAPVNPDLREAEFAKLIPEMEIDVLVAHGLCAEAARRAAAGLQLPVLEVDWDGQGGLRWSGDSLAGAPVMPGDESPDDTALVLLTSGSSARPKRVPLTHRQLALSARRMAESVQLSPADCCLNLMPMFHVGAVVDLLLAPLSAGGSVLRPEVMSVAAFFAAVRSGRPTWFQGVPTLLHELAAHAVSYPVAHPSPLRFIRTVSSPMPLEWLGEIENALGSPLIEIYGMTETAGVITSNPLPPEVRKPGSVGIGMALDVTVFLNDGATARTMERGEIAVRGEGVMGGYEGLAGAAEGIVDGWLRTGDEGYFDADGYLFITGRIGDQINRGGEKISPREIDEVLATHPSVADAAAFALPHAQLGQEVAAAIVGKPGMEVATIAARLGEHVGQRLAYFKVPKRFYLVAELPRGPGGKLRRRLLPEIVSELAPLDDSTRNHAEEPKTMLEKRVAAWWEAELRVPSMGGKSHFFEMGGDSLAAATVTAAIERATGHAIRPAALFDHPTIAAFAAYLEQVLQSNPERILHPAPTSAMDPDLLQRLRIALSVWAGERIHEYSLLVGRNTGATGVPVFWCGQGSGEFDAFAKLLPEDMPVYGSRSLYLLVDKKPPHEMALARMLADEIKEAAAGREIIIGGHCAGGRIAFEAACHLRGNGVPIRMVFMHDVFPARPLDVPVAVGMTASYIHSPFRRFRRAEIILKKRCLAGFKLWFLEGDHDDVYRPHSLPREMTTLISLWSDTGKFQSPSPMVALPSVACRARYTRGFRPRWMRAGRTVTIRVMITNTSKETWLPGERSGFHLGYRWLDPEGRILGDPGESVALPREVPSGDSIDMKLKVTAPDEVGPRLLEIDMVDEGFAWFSEKKSQKPTLSLRLKIQILDRNFLKIFSRTPVTTKS